jgi:hypothetical protein
MPMVISGAVVREDGEEIRQKVFPLFFILLFFGWKGVEGE